MGLCGKAQAPFVFQKERTRWCTKVRWIGTRIAEGVHDLEKVSDSPSKPLGYTIMILPQVHLRKPCYDFYFL